MLQYNVLILTDHTNHTIENSLYSLASTMLAHDLTESIDIASRGITENSAFFAEDNDALLHVTTISSDFVYTDSGHHFTNNLTVQEASKYDLVWLRLPPPLSEPFLKYIDSYFATSFIINNPAAIFKTGSKEFLTNFASVCPPLKICRSIADIQTWKAKFPIVLKPFREYGGKGIIKIDGDSVWKGKEEMSFDMFLDSLNPKDINYLAVKFLKNVSEGDKRIVVVNGKIMGASLRLPAKDSWICNVSMGGSSNIAMADEDEKEIISVIDPIISKLGIVMYGVDTLVGDDGKRVLSEINTTSIGGLPQIAALQGLPLVEEAIDLIWKYYLKNKS